MASIALCAHTMHRFYLPPVQCQGTELELSERDVHHALHVLRLRRDERVAVLDGEGHEFHCRVKDANRKKVSLTVLQKNLIQPSPYQLTLLQAVPKGKAMDTIVQKATELGAFRIVPLLSERVTGEFGEEEGAHKAEKWQTTAIESIKQCGCPWLPRVEAPLSPKSYLARGEKFDLPLVASLQLDSQHPRKYFQAFIAERRKLPKSVCIWVGPEGDFTPGEICAVKSWGALPISLGRLILRSETAAIYCLAVISYELQSEER
jgi:16S rRNA (uracil1498-N3)-methyltransferase